MVDLLFFLFKYAAWLFLLIGTGTMLVGAGYLLHLAWRLKHAQTADGMIVGFVQKTDYWSKVHYLPQVCFTCRDASRVSCLTSRATRRSCACWVALAETENSIRKMKERTGTTDNDLFIATPRRREPRTSGG